MTDGKPRVLLVDDDDDLRRSLARALKQDFSVVMASDGDEAIRLFEADEEFDAIVTDLEMKRVCGDALIAWLLVSRPTIATRVIVLSAGGKTPEREAWLRAFDPARKGSRSRVLSLTSSMRSSVS